MTGKKVSILLVYLLSILMYVACTDEKESPQIMKDGNNSLTFAMTRSPRSIIDNTQIYLFDGDGVDVGKFKQKLSDVAYSPGSITTSVEAGKWDFMLVSADTDFSQGLKQPVRTQTRSAMKLWETQSSGGVLPSMPELRTAYVAGQQVLANQSNTASETALLSRNVALVKVVIADAGGLNVSGNHRLELSNVPTTLNWEGKLLPNKNNPTVASEPMKGNFNVFDHPSQAGHQYSDTLSFIIPAHKGSDYLSASPTDTTTSKLKLKVELDVEGGGMPFKKADVEVPNVPRVNGILLVRIYLGGKLDVSTEILDWEDKSLDVDLSQTLLYTDKASVGLAYKDTIQVNTNASDFTLEKPAAASWITLKKLGSNAVEVTADINTYVDNSPRSSYFTIKANNITKKIPVTQRPDKGTIKISEKKLVFCPNLHVNKSIQVSSLGGNWKFLNTSPKATASVQSGSKGNTTVNFTRNSTTNPDYYNTYYGDGTIVVKNLTTLETDTISLVNCFIDVDDGTINAAAPVGGAASAVTTSQEVKVFGGQKKINVTAKPTWVHNNISWNPGSQELTLTTDREPDDEMREGTMTLQHADCPDYVVSVKIIQDIIITIPPFDYFVLKFTWDGNDVDIAVEFAGNGTTYDKRPVGWNLGSLVTYNNKDLLKWGGDARGGQGETVFFNAPTLEGDTNSPRKIKLEVYSVWFNMGNSPNMTFTMYAYKGGNMVQSGTNFNNNGGVKLYDQGYTVKIDKTYENSKYVESYEHVATITYDRVKHSAAVKVHAMAPTRSEPVRAPLQIEEPEAKPYYPPRIVHTYSDDYKGERK